MDRIYPVLKEAQVETKYLFTDSLGSWIVWNLFDKSAQSQEERELVRVLGSMVVHTFVSWWN